MILRAALFWFGLLIAMFGLGVLREALLTKRLTELRAHQIGSLAGCIPPLVAAHFLAAPDASSAWLAGGVWLVMTLLFEFGFFHYVAKKPWGELLADYKVHEGRLWPLVLVVTFLAPLLMR